MLTQGGDGTVQTDRRQIIVVQHQGRRQPERNAARLYARLLSVFRKRQIEPAFMVINNLQEPVAQSQHGSRTLIQAPQIAAAQSLLASLLLLQGV